MPEENTHAETNAPAAKPVSRKKQLIAQVQRLWRPAGTVVVLLLALFVGWRAFSGKHGVSAWWQTRAQDRALEQEIKNLNQENAQMRQQIQKLQTDPGAIEREAREKLHYTRAGEVIYTLPEAQPAQQQTPTGK
jgi:cell division protein FtsB